MLKKALTTTVLATVLLTSSISANDSKFHDGFILYNGGYNVGVIYPSKNQNVIMTVDDLAYSGPESKLYWDKDNIEISTYGNQKLCLNAHNPRKGSNVNLWTCDKSDSEQHWKWIKTGYKKGIVNLMGTNYCLNAHNVNQGTNVNLWVCNKNDIEQEFTYKKNIRVFPEYSGD